MSATPENVYRPPYEWISVLAIALGLYGLLHLPLPHSATLIVVLILALFGLCRAYSAWRIMRFRKSVRQLPYYALTANQIPVSDKAMFLGKGFRWTQVHTQRLFFIRQPENRHLLEPSRIYRAAREYEIRQPGHNRLTRLSSANAWWNPFVPLPPVGGSPEIHGVEIDERDIWSALGERVGHTLVLGTTRVGKTRLAETLVTQDIKRGDVTIFFDPKGDAEMLIRMYTEAAKAGRTFYLFHLGFPQYSCRYNPIGDYGRITEVATRIANQLPGEGQSAAFKDFVWRYVNVLAKTMEALAIKPTYVDIYRCASNVDELAEQYFELFLDRQADDNWREAFAEDTQEDQYKSIKQQAVKSGRKLRTMLLASFIQNQDYTDANVDALMTILTNDRSYFEKLVSSLYPLLEKLTTGQVAELLSPDPGNLDDTRPIMDWRKVIESNAVVYIGLDSLSDFEVAAAVGNAMFADLTSLAGQIYKHGSGYGQSEPLKKRKVAVHADEFNELIGDEFVPLLNKAGGAGYQVTVYTQTWSDVEAKIGSPAKAAQIGGNLNTLIMLRIKSEETARILTDQLPEVNILSSTLVSGASDIAFPDSYEDFSSRNEDRIGAEAVPMLSPADLITLPKGQAFALIEGGQLYKIRMPLPATDPNEDVPTQVKDIARAMHEKARLSELNEVPASAFLEGASYGQNR